MAVTQVLQVTSAVVWQKDIFPLAFDGKINLKETLLQ